MLQGSIKPARRISWTSGLVVLGLLLRNALPLSAAARPSGTTKQTLILNVLGKSFGEILGPLFYHEAALPGFLLAGEAGADAARRRSASPARLLPFLASCASLLLLAWLARRLLRASAVPWAVLFLAFSDRLLWHSCEAKPYTVDVLLAALLPAMFVATENWTLPSRLLLFTLLAPGALFLSYPGCFLYGGVLLAFLPEVFRSRGRLDERFRNPAPVSWAIWEGEAHCRAPAGPRLGRGLALPAAGPRLRREPRHPGRWPPARQEPRPPGHCLTTYETID